MTHIDLAHSITILIWISLAIYGIIIQAYALRYARRNYRTAIPFGAWTGIVIMAHARLRSNYVRQSIVLVNLLIGVLTLLSASDSARQHLPTGLSIFGWLVTIGFFGNEIAMIVIATLEVRAHARLWRQYHAAMGPLTDPTDGVL